MQGSDEISLQGGRCTAPCKREFKLPWREAGPPNHHDDKVDSDQWVVDKELSLCRGCLPHELLPPHSTMPPLALTDPPAFWEQVHLNL